jgi:hypothetical protein
MKNIKSNIVALTGGLLLIMGIFLTVIVVPIELTQGGMEFENYSFFYKLWTSDMNIFSFEASYFPWNSYFPWDSAGFYLLVLGISSVIFAIINFSIINKCIGCVAFLFLGFALFDFYEIANFDSPRYVYGWELGTGWVILFLGAILNFSVFARNGRNG